MGQLAASDGARARDEPGQHADGPGHHSADLAQSLAADEEGAHDGYVAGHNGAAFKLRRFTREGSMRVFGYDSTDFHYVPLEPVLKMVRFKE